MANSGFNADCAATEALFVRNFSGFDHIVGPSGSCVHHIRDNLTRSSSPRRCSQVRPAHLRARGVFARLLQADAFPWAEFPHRVGLHNGCGSLRALQAREAVGDRGPPFSKPLALLSGVKGIRFVAPARPDECCGFGGTFAVAEEPSVRMGYDKVSDHQKAGAEYIVSADMSCLMHQQGCAERIGLPIKFMHIAQVLNGARDMSRRPDRRAACCIPSCLTRRHPPDPA